jgi:competence protein ComEC
LGLKSVVYFAVDLIRKKLELIDWKLALGPGYVVSQIIDAAPLVLPAVGLIVGIFLQNLIALPIIFWLVLSILLAASAVVYIAFKRTESNIYIIVCLAFFCSMSLGAVRLNSYRYLPANDINNFVGDESTLATIRGTIITEPYISDNNDWVFSKFRFTDPGSSFYLKITEAEGKDGWVNAAGIVRVQVDEAVHDLQVGNDVQMYCWLERINPPTNPGQFDLAKRLKEQNIYIAASVKTHDAIEVLSNQSKTTFFQIKRDIENAAVYVLKKDLPEENPNSNALVAALVLGDRTKIDHQTNIAFRKTGLLHFVSLSGLNFVIMIAFVWWVCTLIGIGKKRQALICIAVSILFVLAVPPNPPVLRAAIISLVFCAAFLFRREPPNSFNSLALAAIILLLFKPLDIYNASWQLSFSTTLGILLFCRRIRLFLYKKISPLLKLIPEEGKLSLLINENSLFDLSGLFSTSLGAWVCGAGFMLYHFNTITPLTAIWTVLASLLVSVIMIIGLLKIVVSFFLPSVAFVLGLVANLLSYLLIWLVKIFAKVSFSEILIGQVSIWIIIFYYCVLFFVAFCLFRRPLLRKIISIVLILVFAISLFAIKFQRTIRSELVLSCIDVGHGQAILVQPPGMANLLFDAGSLYKSDVGRRIIIPFMRSQAISKLDAIIISHNDIDHINAIPEVVNDAKTKSIFANDDFLIDRENSGVPKFLNDYLKNLGFNIQSLDKLRIKSPAGIKIIWPSKDALSNNQLSDNDRSAVIMLEYAGVKILFCSDIEKFAQRKILETYPGLKADIVIAPHHGSTATTDPNFIEKLAPKFLIYSCSQTQYENQSKLICKSTRLFTAYDGLIRIRISNKGKITCSTFVKEKGSPEE